jgi:hypothetical protein
VLPNFEHVIEEVVTSSNEPKTMSNCEEKNPSMYLFMLAHLFMFVGGIEILHCI